MRMHSGWCLAAILLAGVLAQPVAGANESEAGKMKFVFRTHGGSDVFTDSPTAAQQQWMRDHFWRMMVFSPYFDTKTSWFPNGWLYFDSYAIYVDSELSRQHPEWILKDASGNLIYIDYLEGGVNYQYAADVSNPNFRRWWIDEAKRMLPRGYRGLFIDDVNMDFRFSDRVGVDKVPHDVNTNAPMIEDNWRKYMAEFMEQVRRELTGYEILHNSIWYAGGALRDQNPYVKRQIAAADYINHEGGVIDTGLTGGTGIWSLNAVLAYYDRVHAAGKGIIVDGWRDEDNTPEGREYSLGCYFLTSAGRDGLGNQKITPSTWWPGYDVNLGTPLGARFMWNGLYRRDYSGGMVLINEPGAPTRTVTLPTSMKNLSGVSVTSVTLGAKRGIILTGAPKPPPPLPVNGANEVYISDLTWALATNGWGPVEKDKSNGEMSAGDGRTITLNSMTYTKGLGVHAASEVRYALNKRYSRFISDVGVDDESQSWGTVTFQVWADGVKIFDSGIMNATSLTKRVDVDLSGRNELRLIVTDSGDGVGSDHADWAGARLRRAGSGTISREYWSGIPGASVTNLTSHSSFAGAPTGTSQPASFEAPTNFGDNYGTRMRGYVHAPVSGSYTFWIAGDDNCELWLSTDTNPANKRRIASVAVWTSPREWTKYPSQQSAAITLAAGQVYYIEALHKEGGGLDNLAVGWQLPGGILERPIVGYRLSPFSAPAMAAIAASSDPTEESAASEMPSSESPMAPLVVKKFSASLKFSSTGKDALAAVLVLPQEIDGTTLTVDIAGVIRDFEISSGKAIRGATKSLALKQKNGQTTLTVTVKGGSFLDDWIDDGVSNADAKGVQVTLPVRVYVGSSVYGAEIKVIQTSRLNRNASLK
jgi:hypothetical protein